MTFERSPGPPSEPGLAPSPPGPDRGSVPVPEAGGPSSAQLRLQILATEHWSLLASRSLAWNETFARAGMYLSTLSGAMVALGLIAGVDRLGDVFVAFALVILPVVLFLGITTFLRMAVANYHDALTVHGMNRIRGAYLEIAPDLEPYFVMGVRDDARGMAITMATPSGPSVLHLVAATPFLVSVLNGVVAGAICAIAALRALAIGPLPAFAASALVFLAMVLGQVRYARGNIRRVRDTLRPLFPTPPERRGGDAGEGASADGERSDPTRRR